MAPLLLTWRQQARRPAEADPGPSACSPCDAPRLAAATAAGPWHTGNPLSGTLGRYPRALLVSLLLLAALQGVHSQQPTAEDRSRASPASPESSLLSRPPPPFFLGKRLAGKNAVANFGAESPGSIRGTVEFSLCEEDSGVFVKVDLQDNETQNACITDQGATSGPCLYQINSTPLDEEAVIRDGVSACGSPFDVFDPLMSGEKGWEVNETEDICSSTQSSSFGAGSKLASCPVGGLSRKWGVLRSFFDDNLAAFNDIVGRSLMVYSLNAAGVPTVLSCATIRFQENCQLQEKNVLLDFKSSLVAGSELLSSWQPWNDMCSTFFGVRCESLGEVVEVKLDNLTLLRSSAIEAVTSRPTSPAAPRLSVPLASSTGNSSNATSEGSPRVEYQSSTLDLLLAYPNLRLEGTLPDFFSKLIKLEQLSIKDHLFSGFLPESWSTLEQVRELRLAGNHISGSLPAAWQTWVELKSLDLSDNVLEGMLPVEWRTMQQLETLNLELNHLTGSVPREWAPMPELVTANISFNNGLCDPENVLIASEAVACFAPRPKAVPPSGVPPGVPPVIPDGHRGGRSEASAMRDSLLIIAIATACIILFLLAITAGVWANRELKRQSSPPPMGRTSEEAQPCSSDMSGSDRDSSPHRDISLVEVVYGKEEKQLSRTDMPALIVSPFQAVAKSPPSPSAATGDSFHGARRESRDSFGTLRNSRGSASPAASATSSLLHCSSGVHPLDFACVDEVEGASVDRTSLLGSGGYGVVYRGSLQREGKDLEVAIKVISNSDTPEVHMSKYKSFEDEVHTLSLFQGNDCIVKIYDYVLEYPRAMIFYEYLANDTLGRLVHKKLTQRLNYLEVLQMGYGIAEGLATLHAKHVVHRDLKPDNILLDHHMRPRLTDFGISRQKEPGASSITTHNIGTWVYMAPEQFNGRLSEASDMYSLGIILWEIWCGKRPWDTTGDENEIWQVMYKLIHENQRPQIPDSCPTDLANIICDCWRTEPKDRPTSVEVKNRLWKIILEEMKGLNDGPKRATSPDRLTRNQSRQGSSSASSAGNHRISTESRRVGSTSSKNPGSEGSPSPRSKGHSSRSVSPSRRRESILKGAAAMLQGSDPGGSKPVQGSPSSADRNPPWR